jgi:hypothetical protein
MILAARGLTAGCWSAKVRRRGDGRGVALAYPRRGGSRATHPRLCFKQHPTRGLVARPPPRR